MAALFDLDGTLLDTAPDLADTLNQMRVGKHLPPLELSAFRSAVSQGLVALMKVAFNLTPKHPDYPILARELLTRYEHCLGRPARPFPGILELLSELEDRHILWGIVTNRTTQLAIPLLESLNLKQRACCIVGGDTTPYPKPNPEPLFYACREIQVSPATCIYIGDAERDIQAGKAAGMKTIAVLFGYIDDIDTPHEWKADHYVQQVDEILPIILKHFDR